MFNSIEKEPRIINQNEPIDTGEDSVKNERAADLTKEQMDGTTYFDENESREGGSTIDEATGESYKNDADMDTESPEMSTVSWEPKNFDDLEDDNAKLLREKFKNHPEILKELGLE